MDVLYICTFQIFDGNSLLALKINSSTGKKKKLILTESNETYTECSRLQINCAKQFWKKMYTG